MASPAGPVVLVVNTRARRGGELLAQAQQCLAGHQVALSQVRALEDPGQLEQVLRGAVEGGARTVIVGGGDGTLSGSVRVLARGQAVLGILPMGTANDFARSLGVPPSLPGACAVIAAGHTRRIDVGLVNGRPFLNAASLGLSSAITAKLDPGLKRHLGRLAYGMTAARQAWAFEPFRVELVTAEGATMLDALQVVVGNGRFHGGGRMTSPRARIDDHLLDAYVIRAESRGAHREEPTASQLRELWTLARVAGLLKRGRHLAHPAVVALRARAIEVRTRPPLELDVDGELTGTTPATFTLAPEALEVLTPEEGSPATRPETKPAGA